MFCSFNDSALANLLSAISFLLCATCAAASVPEMRLSGRDACFILFDANSSKEVVRYGGARCALRTPPCSTFKVPLAAMGFDSGILVSPDTIFKWDGKPKMLKSWEKDQDATGWIKNSVVWYSQIIARQLGREKMANYLRDFDYGNADMSGGLETAWLSPVPNPKSKVESSIAISADEQVKFLTKLWQSKLSIQKKAQQYTREVTFLETSPRGFVLHGKTGSGFAGKGTKRRLGWFVAHMAKGQERFIGVLTFSDISEPKEKLGYAGPEARDLFKSILRDMGYW